MTSRLQAEEKYLKCLIFHNLKRQAQNQLEHIRKEGSLQISVYEAFQLCKRDAEGQSYNVNADIAAAEIAVALHAEKLVFLTDVKGILRDAANEHSLLSTVRVREVDELIASEVIAGGMIPKVNAGVKSVKGGVHKTHIIDGRIPHAMLLEFFTDEGIGTQIVH